MPCAKLGRRGSVTPYGHAAIRTSPSCMATRSLTDCTRMRSARRHRALRGRPTGAFRSIVVGPLALYRRRVQQGLHHYTILFCLFSQGAELFGCGLWSDHIKLKMDVRKTDRDVFCDAQSTAEVEGSFDADGDFFG